MKKGASLLVVVILLFAAVCRAETDALSNLKEAALQGDFTGMRRIAEALIQSEHFSTFSAEMRCCIYEALIESNCFDDTNPQHAEDVIRYYELLLRDENALACMDPRLKSFIDGFAAFNQNRYAEAYDTLRTLLMSDTLLNDTDTLCPTGVLYSFAYRCCYAIRCGRGVPEETPYIGTFYVCGEDYYRIDEALLDPDFFYHSDTNKLKYYRASLLILLDDPENAEPLLSELAEHTETNRDQAKILLLLGKMYLTTHASDYGKASDFLKRSLSLIEPHDGDLRLEALFCAGISAYAGSDVDYFNSCTESFRQLCEAQENLYVQNIYYVYFMLYCELTNIPYPS